MSASGPSCPLVFDVPPFFSSTHSKCLVRSIIHTLLWITQNKRVLIWIFHIYTCRARTILNASLQGCHSNERKLKERKIFILCKKSEPSHSFCIGTQTSLIDFSPCYVIPQLSSMIIRS